MIWLLKTQQLSANFSKNRETLNELVIFILSFIKYIQKSRIESGF
ncbi:hypothetical protein J559_2595 [Acinetobacter sp. 983759]|nr:hypothetical protein J550_2720 [Acinetobacter sp. 230853]EXE13164.1 hypothetical protein J559_2595 [Acinetobacter sp. 983759]